MTTTFETASIGNRVWCISIGWGSITHTHYNDDYPILVKFDSGKSDSFTMGGRLYLDDVNPTLFWDEIKFDVPSKPLPKLNKDDCVEVWGCVKVWDSNTNPSVIQKRHFSHFEDGLIFCFGGGGTSWTTTGTTGWNHWRKPE